MSKRALSPSPETPSSTSSSSRLTQRCFRFQLLHDLPASLLSQVCSFLSVHETVSILRSTCHALHGSVTPNCLLQSHLAISGRSLPALIAATPSTRVLISRVPSVDIVYQLEQGDDPQHAMLPLQELRSPVDASRFLFSSLTSLHVSFDHSGGECPSQLGQSSLLSVLQLLEADAASFSSLRRLGIGDYSGMVSGLEFELPFSSLTRLPALTHCRIHLWTVSATSCSSLLSMLSSLQSLPSLDLGDSVQTWPQLLQLLCSDAATPLLLRLKSLMLPHEPYGDDSVDGSYDALLRRLSSLPAASVLQRFSGTVGTHSAAGLLSVFSLPRLRVLELGGMVRLQEFCALTSRFTSAPAPLVSLDLPDLLIDRAAEDEDALAVSNAVRQLLSRFTTLRRLRCDAAMASGAVALPGSLPGSGCSRSLYSLSVTARDDEGLPRIPFTPFTIPLSFPLLTELFVQPPLKDAELELLLPACAQLLRLSCVVSESWKVVLIAARCSGPLLDLSVDVVGEEPDEEDDGHNYPAPQPVASPFLPQLINLRLHGGRARPHPKFSDFSVLRHFTTPPHAQLRRVDLQGSGLTAHHVLSLPACRVSP